VEGGGTNAKDCGKKFQSKKQNSEEGKMIIQSLVSKKNLTLN